MRLLILLPWSSVINQRETKKRGVRSSALITCIHGLKTHQSYMISPQNDCNFLCNWIFNQDGDLCLRDDGFSGGATVGNRLANRFHTFEHFLLVCLFNLVAENIKYANVNNTEIIYKESIDLTNLPHIMC